MQALYKGITFEVIRCNDEEILLSQNGNDRQFAKTLEVRILPDPTIAIAIAVTPEPVTTPEPTPTKSSSKATKE